jgi:hypothetical protein
VLEYHAEFRGSARDQFVDCCPSHLVGLSWESFLLAVANLWGKKRGRKLDLFFKSFKIFRLPDSFRRGSPRGVFLCRFRPSCRTRIRCRPSASIPVQCAPRLQHTVVILGSLMPGGDVVEFPVGKKRREN